MFTYFLVITACLLNKHTIQCNDFYQPLLAASDCLGEEREYQIELWQESYPSWRIVQTRCLQRDASPRAK